MKKIKKRSTTTVLAEILGAVFIFAGLAGALGYIMFKQDFIMAGAVFSSLLFSAIVLNIGVEILQSLWRIEAHLVNKVNSKANSK